jgi:adenine-specific DNA-methyltransferase
MSRSILGLATKDQRPNLHYDVVEPSTGRVFPPNPSTGWRYSTEKMSELVAHGRILFPKKDDGRPREKKFRKEMKGDFIPFRTIIDDVHTADGTQEIRSLFGVDVFPFPKQVALLASIVEQVTSYDDIVLDFFAGAAPLAQAVMQINASDGGRRRFVVVQLQEACGEKSEAYKAGFKTIADIAKERIRRSGAKILAGDWHPDWNKDIGFRVLKVDTSNMKAVYYQPDALAQGSLLAAVDNIKEGRTPEDLLFQVLVGWGVDLTLPIRHETVQGKAVFFVNEKPYDLVACFDTGITEKLIKELARHEPLRVVFRDHGFVSDTVKINAEQIFRQLSPSTDVRSI